jgi:glycosyltransferase involved in cell wall biosynthesis
MKILQFTLTCPFPPLSGGEIKCATNARVLSAIGEVLTVSFTGPPTQTSLPNVKHLVIGSSHRRGAWQSHNPHPTMRMMAADELAEADALWRAYAPDLVVVENIVLTQLLDLAPQHHARIVVDLHDIDSQTEADRIAGLPLWKRLRGLRENRRRIERAQDADRRAAAVADQVWVCSEIDRALLTALGPVGDIRVIANPIPDESVLSLPIATRRYEELHLCFVGHLGYFPNIDAIKQIGRKMVPRLAASGRDWSMTVAGKTPHDLVRQICAKHGLRLVASPPDLPDLLASAGYAPIPLRYGGGTRIKVLEAMAAGLVVCATEKAVEGLSLQDGRHFLAGRDAGDLATKILALAARPEAGAEMARAGRAFVRDRHSSVAIGQEILHAVADLKVRRPD